MHKKKRLLGVTVSFFGDDLIIQTIIIGDLYYFVL